jgi:hypothetical protein
MTEPTVSLVIFYCASQHCTEPGAFRVDLGKSFLTACPVHADVVRQAFPMAVVSPIPPGYRMPEGYEKLSITRKVRHGDRDWQFVQTVGAQRIPCRVCRGTGHSVTGLPSESCAECGGIGYKA